MADVFRRFGPAFREQHDASLSGVRRRAMIAIESCRTAALGGHVERCGACGHQRIAYDSCRNPSFPLSEFVNHCKATISSSPGLRLLATMRAVEARMLGAAPGSAAPAR